MKWNKFRLKTTTESEDLVSSMLMDLGIQGIEIEDKIAEKLIAARGILNSITVDATEDGITVE